MWIDVTDFNNTARYAQSLFAITALADDRALGTPIALTDRAIRAHNRVNELVNSR